MLFLDKSETSLHVELILCAYSLNVRIYSSILIRTSHHKPNRMGLTPSLELYIVPDPVPVCYININIVNLITYHNKQNFISQRFLD